MEQRQRSVVLASYASMSRAVTAFAIVAAGPFLGRLFGISGPFEAVWSLLQWPLAMALVVLAIAVIN